MITVHKKRKILVGIVIFFALFLGLKYVVDTVIRNKLDALIENLPDYSIKYQDIKVGLFYQNIEISDIEILPKKAQPDSLSSQLSIFFKIKSLHINEIGVGSLLFNKTVKIDHILFDNCTVMSVKKSTSNLRNVVKKPMHIDANKIQLSGMNAIHIEALKFVDLSYEVYDLGLHEKSQRVLYIDPVCFELHGIHLNKNIDDVLLKIFSSQSKDGLIIGRAKLLKYSIEIVSGLLLGSFLNSKRK